MRKILRQLTSQPRPGPNNLDDQLSGDGTSPTDPLYINHCSRRHSQPPPMAPSPHLRVLLLLLLLFPIIAVSQPPPPSRNNNKNNSEFGTTNFNSSTAVVIVVLLSAFFFLAFFSLYIRQCSLGRPSNIGGPARVFAEGGRRSPGRGLDSALLETFPTFAYSEVKELKFGKEVLECAVCLSDFSDHETLRLLPACNHVFHPECIDVWLGSHVTCPVCRTNLAASPVGSNNTGEDDNTLEDHVAITVAEDEQTPRRTFGRSHTTGHSVSLPSSAGCDRHTLRLPEQVRKEILAARKFRRATSCVGFEGGGEASGRRGYRSMGGRSERWGTAFFARAMSMRVPAWAAGRRGEGEESVNKGEGSFKSRPFDCLGGGAGGERDDEESSTAPFARV